MTDDPIQLTRRKLLASTGAIGLASAGAGLGTTAYFSDEESFTDNSFAAGELDLVVDYFTDREQGATGTAQQGQIDGTPGTYSYTLSDVKPGDSGTLVFCPKLVDNDGWLWVGSDGVTDYENGQPGPEAAVDASGGGTIGTPNDGESAGELSDAIEIDLSYCSDVSINGDQVSVGTTIRPFNNRDDYDLAALGKDLETGVLLDGDASGATADPYPGSPDDDTQTGPCLCVEWELPADIGNEVQTDAAEIDFTFVALQARHNADPPNPFVDSTVGQGSGFDYNSIQTAVDDAATGDVISVAAGTYLEQVTVDTQGVTLVAASGATPTIDGDDASPAVSVAADGVTVDGFEITNPGQLLGIKVQPGIDDVTICNNRIFDVGPTGTLGVSGIVVGQGDHRNVTIVDNVIEDLFQEDDGSFATLNGILFDTAGSGETITDTTVARNTIRNLASTTAPLGVVVQHEVANFLLSDNEITDLTADNSLGAGSFTTFAQGLSIDSPATATFDIVGNTIQNVESANGFFGEDIKVESSADVSGITVSGNNLLSAIGLNNANGANPTIDAEHNWWGDAGGPLVIQNNEDDGDVPTGSGQVDLDTVTESAVTQNVDFDPFATSPL